MKSLLLLVNRRKKESVASKSMIITGSCSTVLTHDQTDHNTKPKGNEWQWCMTTEAMMKQGLNFTFLRATIVKDTMQWQLHVMAWIIPRPLPPCPLTWPCCPITLKHGYACGFWCPYVYPLSSATCGNLCIDNFQQGQVKRHCKQWPWWPSSD